MLLQSLRAPYLAPRGPGSIWNYLGAPVRSTEVSGRVVCRFWPDLQFADASRYLSNKFQFQWPCRLWTVNERTLIEPSSPKRSETSQLDLLYTVTTEDMVSLENEETNEAVDEEILAETAEETKMKTKNTASCSAK